MRRFGALGVAVMGCHRNHKLIKLYKEIFSITASDYITLLTLLERFAALLGTALIIALIDNTSQN